jgi:hypothetical protein
MASGGVDYVVLSWIWRKEDVVPVGGDFRLGLGSRSLANPKVISILVSQALHFPDDGAGDPYSGCSVRRLATFPSLR